MRRARKILLIVLGLVIGVPVIAVIGVFVALNTGAGRHFVSAEIGKLSGDRVRISGLGGHFPKDIKARRIAVADAKG
ncbi:MAG TPA: hypothetical protein VFN77_07350, partial [Acetobacteraceae bacterium]|nr:hypothetical protein [Acetobacteraceae bacterium]